MGVSLGSAQIPSSWVPAVPVGRGEDVPRWVGFGGPRRGRFPGLRGRRRTATVLGCTLSARASARRVTGHPSGWEKAEGARKGPVGFARRSSERGRVERDSPGTLRYIGRCKGPDRSVSSAEKSGRGKKSLAVTSRGKVLVAKRKSTDGQRLWSPVSNHQPRTSIVQGEPSR